MEVYLQFIILGLGAGVIFAGLALGLVMTYRASGVVNFAHGAIAAYAADNSGRIPATIEELDTYLVGGSSALRGTYSIGADGQVTRTSYVE